MGAKWAETQRRVGRMERPHVGNPERLGIWDAIGHQWRHRSPPNPQHTHYPSPTSQQGEGRSQEGQTEDMQRAVA